MLLIAIFAIIALASSFWLLSRQHTTPGITVSFVRYSTNSAGQTVGTFSIVNLSSVTLVAENSWTQAKDAPCPILTNEGTIMVFPGATNLISIAAPADALWRFGLADSPRLHNWKNNLKIRLSMSPIAWFIPRNWLGVVGSQIIFSDWVAQ